jgi:hypothetical protein
VTAGALLLVLLLRANPIVVLMQSNADLASPLVIAEEAHRYPDAQIATGRLGWWGGLWVLQLLRPLPGNSYLGSYLPMVVTILVAALLALQAGRLWGRLAPWIVLVVALGVGAETWANLAAWSSRAPSWWAMGLLGVVTVAAAGTRSRRSRIALAVAAVLVLLWTAVVASGDQEATIALLPLAACGLYACRERRWGLGATMLVAAATTFGLSQLVATLAENAGYLRQSFPLSTTTFDGLGDAFANVLLGLQDVWRGPKVAPWTLRSFATTVGTVAAYVGMAVAVVAVGTALVTAARAWRGRPAVPSATERRPETPLEARAPDGGAPTEAGDAPSTRVLRRGDREVQRGLWATFWAVGLLVYLLAFVGTTAGGTLGEPVVRYLYGVPMAAAAAIAPLAARRRPWALTAAVVTLGVATIVGYVVQRPEPAPTADASNSRLFRQIGAVVAAEGVTRGYAGYWTAYPLVLQSGFKLDVTPVARCGQTPGLCTMYLHYIDRAYEPRPGIRSFLVVDGSAVAREQFSQASVTELPSNLKPTKVAPVGDGMYVAFFDHDIAADLEPNRGLGDPRMGKGGPLEPLPSQ